MDVMVQCEKDGIYKGEVFYIPIVIGDAKEHLFPDGLYQTGIPFNEDRGKMVPMHCGILFSYKEK